MSVSSIKQLILKCVATVQACVLVTALNVWSRKKENCATHLFPTEKN